MTEISDKIVDRVAGPVLEAAKAACQSRTLRDALTAERTDDGFILSVPHYWAIWFEDGRGGVNARTGHKLVFYKNPADDPRLAGGYPVRLADVRRLSKAEFYRDLRAGKLVVKDSVGPAPPHSFMGDALTTRASQIVQQAAVDAAQQAVKNALGPLFKTSVTTTL